VNQLERRKKRKDIYHTDERNQLSFIITAGERERERETTMPDIIKIYRINLLTQIYQREKRKKIKQDKKKGFEPDEMKSSSMTKKKTKKRKTGDTRDYPASRLCVVHHQMMAHNISLTSFTYVKRVMGLIDILFRSFPFRFRSGQMYRCKMKTKQVATWESSEKK
jgi:hypothetical protein